MQRRGGRSEVSAEVHQRAPLLRPSTAANGPHEEAQRPLGMKGAPDIEEARMQKRTALTRQPWGEHRRVTEQTERAFQAQVIELATYLGWWCWHPYYASRSPKGYPDLTMFRERVLFVELKARNAKGRMGKLMPEQIEMAHRCIKAGAEYYHWTPDDWDEIEAVLSRGGSVTVAE